MLENIKPEKVFSYFEQLSKIPRGSGNTKMASDWIVDFAKKRNLEYYQDELNNVIIIKNATKGYEISEAVILQGHIDMVCEKAADCTKDMEKEGIDILVEGDVISADGTTLGADNGIAVAMILAILDSEDLEHPRLECIFTVDEETGLYGAAFIDVSMLKGKTFINIDSEDEGIFTVSCAGGNVTECKLGIEREDFEGKAVKIKISGLTGGHSGIEIHKGRANSNILMGRLLYQIKKSQKIRVVSVNGGLKNNAIPVETVAEVIVENYELCKNICEEFENIFKYENRCTDADVTIKISESEYEKPLTEQSGDKLIFMLNALPNGVIYMSNEIEDLVQTSLNMGIFKTEEKSITSEMCVRSSIDSQREMLTERIKCIMEGIGGSVQAFGEYAGWDYKEKSYLRNLMVEVFKDQYGYEPRVEAIHAGLECGVFSGKIKELDCISFGPDIDEVHTFREKMYISSVSRVYDMLVEALRRMK